MKFAIIVISAFICVGFIQAETIEKTWGDVHNIELGRELVAKDRIGVKHATYTFTYPKKPTDRRIVGMKQIDLHPSTRVEIVEGNWGDCEVTIRVTAEGHHAIDCQFIFYTSD